MTDSDYEILEDAYRQEIGVRSSKPYRIGLKIVNLYNSIRLGFFIENIKREYHGRQLKRNSIQLPSSEYRYGVYPNENIKILVYTCITGGYDDPMPPLFNIPNTDYILYKDNINKVEGWQVRAIPDEIMQIGNGTLINRYYKMHPSVVAKDYDFAIYIDGNIQVMSNVRNIINAVSPTTGLAIHRHPSRNCIYDEYKACKILKKGNLDKLKKQIEDYKCTGFPSKFGLLECTIIVSDLHNDKSSDLLDKWWNEFKNSSSMRDQISLPYIIWKYGYCIDDIGNLGNNLRINPKFKYITHKDEHKFMI